MNEHHKKLILEFADSIIAQNLAINEHDPEAGNAFAKRYIEASKQLLQSGEPGIEALSSLLKDQRIEVRAMTASCLLPYRKEQALLVLREAAKCKGITGLGASMTLKRWEAGDAGWHNT